MIDLVSPESVGLSTPRLARVTEWLQAQISSQRLAGASVLIGRHGKPAYFEVAGLADIKTGQRFAPDTIVRIFSMTKAVTTVAAMMLYEEGHFQLDDPVAKYLPEFAETPVWSGGDKPIDDVVPQASPITIRQLMTHTSGLTYGFMQSNVVDAEYRKHKIEFQGPNGTLQEQIQKLATIPLLCQPGSQWNYSVATDVLGRLVEIWSGDNLATFFGQRIFSPLRMDDAGFHVATPNHARFATLYSPLSGADMSNVGRATVGGGEDRGGLKEQDAATTSAYLQPTQLYSGGGGLAASMSDYSQLCRMLMNNGELNGVRLLGRKTVEYMRINHLPDNKDMAAMGQPVWSETSYDGIGFGLGFAVVLDPVKAHIITSVGEYHWGGAASTFFWLDPVEQLYTVFYTQLMPSSTYPIRRELRARVYQALVD